MASSDVNRTSYRPDVDLGPIFLAVSWSTLSLAMVMVALRLYLRSQVHANDWDDYLIYLALPMSIGISVLDVSRVRNGFGRHTEYIQPTLKFALSYTLLNEMLSVITTFFIKMSVCLFVRRIIRGTHHPTTAMLSLIAGILFVVTLMACIVLGTQFRSVHRIWDPQQPGRWFPLAVLTPLLRLIGASGAAIDSACVIIPIVIIGKLQLNKRTKRAIIIVLMLGFITAACGIGKSVTVEVTAPDPTYDYVPYGLWSVLERNLGFVVACMPILRPWFANMFNMSAKRPLFTMKRPRKGQDVTVPRMLDQPPKTYEHLGRDHNQPMLMKSHSSVKIRNVASIHHIRSIREDTRH